MKTLKEALQHRGVLGRVSSADWIRVVGSSLGEQSGVLRSSPHHVVLWAHTNAVAAELRKVEGLVASGLVSLGYKEDLRLEIRVMSNRNVNRDSVMKAVPFRLENVSEDEQRTLEEAMSVVKEPGLREALKVWLNRRPIMDEDGEERT